MSKFWVRAEHLGVKFDSDDQRAVLFVVPEDVSDLGHVWVPRSLLKSYDEESMVIPQWKAEELEIDYEFE